MCYKSTSHTDAQLNICINARHSSEKEHAFKPLIYVCMHALNMCVHGVHDGLDGVHWILLPVDIESSTISPTSVKRNANDE